MKPYRSALVMASVAWSVVASGCVDAPVATAVPSTASTGDDNPLALTFDALALSASQSGDLARSEGFALAALSVRSGVNPSTLQLRIAGNESETLDAFVTVAEFSAAIPSALRPPSRRTLVAWRRSGNGALRVVSLLSPSDSATVLSPLTPGLSLSSRAVYAGASAQFLDLAPSSASTSAVSSTWFATNGWVKLRPSRSVGSCGKLAQNSKIGGVTCAGEEYAVDFSTAMERLTGSPLVAIAGGPILVAATKEQLIAGNRLTFSCASPSGTTGCR